ncbi:class I SAM-dependent methyltransferase [candidate division KSB1 bacterium]|nr:class I SAM-dependent methyltransferase [candidate division KSB1 bacterium]
MLGNHLKTLPLLSRLFNPPSAKLSTETAKNIRTINALTRDQDRLLLVGGGVDRHGNHIHDLRPQILNQAINLEIEPGHNVTLVADAHELPFRDQSFDLVISQAVLEHTRNSQNVVREIHRVLKSGGLVYAEIPFLQPVHMSSDYRRFSLQGIRELFQDFDEIKSGPNGGVASSFALISIQLGAALFSFNRIKLYHIGCLVFGWLLFPIKHLDRWLVRHPLAEIAAAGMYFLGRKG